MGAALQTLLQQLIVDTWNNVHSQSKQKALGSILTTHCADTRCVEGEFYVHVEITGADFGCLSVIHLEIT